MLIEQIAAELDDDLARRLDVDRPLRGSVHSNADQEKGVEAPPVLRQAQHALSSVEGRI